LLFNNIGISKIFVGHSPLMYKKERAGRRAPVGGISKCGI